VSETDKYSIRYSTSYESHLRTLLKIHYKKNQQALEQFRGFFNELTTILESEPRKAGDPEPWPRGTYQEGWDLRKVRFKMPGLGGEAREGRFVYLIECETRTVVPLVPYTHKQYSGRPDALLKAMIEDETS
jgi:hypothetical protein